MSIIASDEVLKLKQEASSRVKNHVRGPLTDSLASMRDRDSWIETHISAQPALLDPWLTCSHEVVQALSAAVECTWARTIDRDRKRQLKEVDRYNRAVVLHAVLANLALAYASGTKLAAVSVSLRAVRQKATRYDRGAFRSLPAVLQSLSESGGILTLTRSRKLGTASSVTAGPVLLGMLSLLSAAQCVGSQHFRQEPGRETIVLGRIKRDIAAATESRELIDYRDTSTTISFRQEMKTINHHLASADLRFEPDGGPPVMTGLRALRRHFNLPANAPSGTERFDLGGRLFGGWWLSLTKARRHAIRIESEPVADLDFASMFLRLSYIEAGCAPPDGDLYARVEGHCEAQWRPGLKQVVSAMLFRSSPLLRLPRGSASLLPPGTTAPSIRQAILKAYPELTCLFETAVGLRLMFIESQILTDALLALIAENIVALPMHDGLMIAQSEAATASTIMQDAAERITGRRLPISLRMLG